MAHHERDHAGGGGGGYDASRRSLRRPVTDHGSTMVEWARKRCLPGVAREAERPSHSYIVDLAPPIARRGNAGDSIPAKHLHTSTNKQRHPINVVKWTPEGRRLLTGSSQGEFTLWNGMAFNFETIMAAHDSAIRAAEWTHDDEWLISADQGGVIKYWQPTFNNVKEIRGHAQPIRDVAIAPTDQYFATASDDHTIKIWDFAAGMEHTAISGHGWDVKTVDWHPQKGMLISGSKDHQVKMWDPRNGGRCLTTLHGHKTPISKVAFEPNAGQLFATCARDPVARVFDIRMMRDVFLLRGHSGDITTLCWHPIHGQLISTAGNDGSINHHLLDDPLRGPEGSVLSPSKSPYDCTYPFDNHHDISAQSQYPAHRIQYAHEYAVWSLDWHPLGHILCSGSNDRLTRFWTRPRPGDTAYLNDRYHKGEMAEPQGAWRTNKQYQQQQRREEEMEAEDEADALVDQKMPSQAQQNIVPGLPGITAAIESASAMAQGKNGQSALPDMHGVAFPAIPPMPQQAIPANEALNGQQPQNNLPFPPMPGFPPGQPPDLAQLQELFGGQIPPPPMMLPGMQQPGQIPPPPLPGFPAGLPPHVPPPGFPGMPPGAFPPVLPPANGMSQTREFPNDSAGSVRKRAPLPSQEESMSQAGVKRGSRR